MADEFSSGQIPRVIAIGGSAGSIEPLITIVRSLPPDFAPPIFVVVHTSPNYSGLLAKLLDLCGTLPAVNTLDGDVVQENRIYVACPDMHLTVTDSQIHSMRGPKENRHRPAIDPLLRSIAATYGTRAIGVLLSGMMDDGAAGLMAIKRGGGLVMVQDPATAQHSSMPLAAINLLACDYVLPPKEIALQLVKLAASGEQYVRRNKLSS